ncbi:hypothetical protein NDU88_005005 [Pleurodeles waltl]|uniref:Uncharacterized protein n=1 Tax=Pleurodeles waltl TaxID=8319 RepID=A0AAV7WXF8_PLEWA|nr:hypothetical protein NDU88_005005 [Pleurodeles waltl]
MRRGSEERLPRAQGKREPARPGDSPEGRLRSCWVARLRWAELFGALRRDFATLKQEIAAEVKELKREVIELGQRVYTLEQAQEAREEDLDCHRRELLTLPEMNQELQYQTEDLENRSRRSNIRIKGVTSQAVTGKLEDFVERLFRHVTPDLKGQTVVLDRTHRVGRSARTPGQAQDILTCLHCYKQREIIMAAVRD